MRRILGIIGYTTIVEVRGTEGVLGYLIAKENSKIHELLHKLENKDIDEILMKLTNTYYP